MESLASLLALIFFIYLMSKVMKYVFTTVGLGFLFSQSSNDSNNSNSKSNLNPLLAFFKHQSNKAKNGMMHKQDEAKIFKYNNKGVLLDGKNKRLSIKDSCNHLAVVSRTGGGKTTSYVLPNIYKLANDNCSIVLTDLSGEIYEKTSGYLKSKGFKVYILDPLDLKSSCRFNPLYYATSPSKIDKVAEILISSNQAGSISGDSKFWHDGGKSLLSMIIKTLMNTQDHKLINLANVRHMINNYHTFGFASFINDYADDKTHSEYMGFKNAPRNTQMSYVSTVNTALSPIGINDDLEILTASHNINFDKLREEKSVIYIKVPSQDQDQYSFLLNIFYTQLFDEMMKKIPSSNDLPVFTILDEFGNMRLPNFVKTITTIRKYKVSISIILQDTNQLEAIYGKNESKTILNGGIANKLYFSGGDPFLTKQLFEIFGQKEIVELNLEGRWVSKDKQAVMTQSEIRTMDDNEVLFLMSNKLPLKIIVKPYYKDMMYSNFSKQTPYKPNSSNMDDTIEYYYLDTQD